MSIIHERVQKHLDATEVPHQIRPHMNAGRKIRSPNDFAESLGYELGRVTKSVFCRSHTGSTYAVLVAPMDRRIKFKDAADILGCGRLELANADDLLNVTGYPKHGVSPFGLGPNVAVVVDRGLLGYMTVLVGGGAVGVEIEVDPSHLTQATNAIVIDLSE